MEVDKLARLNCLFEKALDNNTKLLEKRELDKLYNEYINEGRGHIKRNITIFPKETRRSAS